MKWLSLYLDITVCYIILYNTEYNVNTDTLHDYYA